MTILVTGAKGMIGSQLVDGLLEAGYTVVGIDRSSEEVHNKSYHYIVADLADKYTLKKVSDVYHVDRFIHLAALAHTEGEKDLSWERYKHTNVDCAKNVFDVAENRPVLFISTVDVFGFYDGKEPLDGSSPVNPISKYGKSKVLAEEECKKLKHYTIFRLSPVYTNSVTRDIRKRYYLKYPSIAYMVGKGTHFEILNINGAIDAMVTWCGEEPCNNIQIIKDEKTMWTPDYITSEKEKGNAKIVLHFPRWIVYCGYVVLKGIFGKNEKMYLLNKALYPLRTH